MPTESDIATAHSITPLFYDAVLDPRRWEVVLCKLTNVVGGRAAQIALADMANVRVFFTADWRVDPEVIKKWLEAKHLKIEDPRDKYMLEHPNKVFHCRQAVTDEEMRKSEFYKKLMRPADLEYGVGLMLFPDDTTIGAALAILRGRADGAFTGADVDRLQLYIPHLRQALRLVINFDQRQRSLSTVRALLDQMAQGVLVVDHDGRIFEINRAAEAVLARKDGLRRGPDNRLCTGDPTTTKQLRDALFQIGVDAVMDAAPQTTSLQIERSSGGKPYYLAIRPLAADLDGLAAMRPEGGLAAVYLVDPDVSVETEPERLQRLFGLTATEANIVKRFADGEGLRDIAHQTDRSCETVRWHLKQVMSKVGVNRQVDLATAVRAVAAPADSSAI